MYRKEVNVGKEGIVRWILKREMLRIFVRMMESMMESMVDSKMESMRRV